MYCDADTSMARGVYSGGLIVVGNVTFERVAASPPPPVDKPLERRERATLLCIIGALAANAKLDLSQPMKAGEAIVDMMPDVNLSPRTIGEHLKAVRNAMDSRKG